MYFKFYLNVVLILIATSIRAGTFPAPDEVMRRAFGEVSSSLESLILLDEELKQAKALSDQEDLSALVSRYAIEKGGERVGYAYLDKHRVRTLPETLLIVLNAEGVVHSVHVLAFREPLEYLPREAWYEQFKGKAVEDEIRMRKNIDGITGATLSARATTQAARRVLALHRVLEKRSL